MELTISDIRNKFSDLCNLIKNNVLFKNELTIIGTIKEQSRTTNTNGNISFDLIDEKQEGEKEKRINVFIPGSIQNIDFNAFVPGDVVKVTGRLNINTNGFAKGFDIIQIIGYDIQLIKSYRVEYEKSLNYIRNYKCQSKVLSFNKPSMKIVVVSPKNGTAFNSIKSQLSKNGYFTVSHYPINTYNIRVISNAIDELSMSNYDIIILSRDGYDNLNAFNDINVIKSIVNCKKFVISCINDNVLETLNYLYHKFFG